jgi:hypothetical protein
MVAVLAGIARAVISLSGSKRCPFGYDPVPKKFRCHGTLVQIDVRKLPLGYGQSPQVVCNAYPEFHSWLGHVASVAKYRVRKDQANSWVGRWRNGQVREVPKKK